VKIVATRPFKCGKKSMETPPSFPGDPRQHRFFGIYAPQGITRLDITNVRQIDHLQYGYAIPEPATTALALGGLALFIGCRRKQ